MNGTFSPQVLKESESLISFISGARSAVEYLTDLTSTRVALGSDAADFELESLDGKEIASRDLRGSIVVLDFWATWCVPCWTALKETQALSSLGRQRKVAGRNFRGQHFGASGPDRKEKLDRVRSFWKSQDFTMPTIVGYRNPKYFSAYGSPGLPSVMIVSPSGKILRNHEGLSPEMLATLKRELRERSSRKSNRLRMWENGGRAKY